MRLHCYQVSWRPSMTTDQTPILIDAILPSRALDKRLQEDWARDAREGPRVLMSLKVDFGPMG